MKCFQPTCARSAPRDTLFRVNAKGGPGVWACAEHRLERDSQLDAVVAEVQAGRTQRRCGHPLGTTRWCPDCELVAIRAARSSEGGDK